MSEPHLRVSRLILDQLGSGEKRVLSLVVAIRRVLQQTEVFRGDLPAVTKLALKKLIADGEVFEMDGVYSLRRSERAAV